MDRIKRASDTVKETMGLAYPLFISVVSIAIMATMALLMVGMGEGRWFDIDNIRYDIIRDVGRFIRDHLLLFFVLTLFNNYADYFIDRYRAIGRWVRPLITATTVVVIAWVFVEAFGIITKRANIGGMSGLIDAVSMLYVPIFFFTLLVGYAVAYADYAKEKE